MRLLTPCKYLATLLIGSSLHCSSLLAEQSVADSQAKPTAAEQSKPESKGEAEGDNEGWKKLVDSAEMQGWESINFGGEGEVSFNDGILKMESGTPMTGIRYTKKDFPTENYEIRWKARRVRGSDFFVGITFPIGEEHCSLICGGWGGGLIGISSINGNNASENQTTRYGSFKNGQWYSFRIRVDAKQLTAWVDGEEDPIVVDRADTNFSVRAESRPTRPLGYSGFESLVEVKDWEYRLLAPGK